MVDIKIIIDKRLPQNTMVVSENVFEIFRNNPEIAEQKLHEKAKENENDEKLL